MMKRKHLIILIIILVVVIAAWLLMHLKNERQEEKEAQETEENEIRVTEFSADGVEQIVFGTEGSEIRFEKQEDTWVYPDDADFAVDQDTVGELLSSVSDIVADAQVEDASDPSEYGFDAPTCHADLTMSDGSELTLTFGMENSVVSGYYLMTSQDDGIYLVSDSYITYLEYTLEDFEQEEEETEEETEEAADGEESGTDTDSSQTGAEE